MSKRIHGLYKMYRLVELAPEPRKSWPGLSALEKHATNK